MVKDELQPDYFVHMSTPELLVILGSMTTLEPAVLAPLFESPCTRQAQPRWYVTNAIRPEPIES